MISLRLQQNNFKSAHLIKVTEALSENVLLQDLDLNCNKLCRTNFDANLHIILNLTSFVANNKRLRHLNIQGMHLSLALEKPPKVEEKVVEKPSPKKGDKKGEQKGAKKEPKKSEKKCCDDKKGGIHD